MPRSYSREEIEILPPEAAVGVGVLSPRQLQQLERFLDNRFSVLGVKFGFDALIGLVPVAGDAFSALVSSVIIADAARRGARKRTLLRMAGNVGLDFVAGSIPLVGDIFDVGFRAATRNMALHRREFASDD